MESNRYSYERLYAEEFSILEEAKADLLQPPSSRDEILQKYARLTEHYDKLLRTALKLSRISDIQGNSLNVKNRRLKQQSETDFLTGLYNVRKLGESIPAWAAAGHPFVLMLLDIDYFKQINDNYGHLSGDEVLRALANILKDQTRPGDLVYRSGGEEFLVLLHDIGMERAESIAEHIRMKVEASRLWLPNGASVGITISIGLAAYAPGLSSEQLLGHADDALYASKAQGRNRVTLYRSGMNREG